MCKVRPLLFAVATYSQFSFTDKINVNSFFVQLFIVATKKTSNRCITGFFQGNPPVTNVTITTELWYRKRFRVFFEGTNDGRYVKYSTSNMR